MLPQHHVALENDGCPIAEQLLGEIYRSNAHGLNEIIATVSPTARALLAVYCYRRAHLASIGLAIAALCEEDDLITAAGNAGAMLFERSRAVSPSEPIDTPANGRRKVTLSAGLPALGLFSAR
jgi:hypothetical protein